MNLLCILLMACANSPDKRPAFDPAGLFELNLTSEQTFSSQYRNGSSDYGTGRMKGMDVGDSAMLNVTYNKASRTATIEGIPVVLERSSMANDTGWEDPTSDEWNGMFGSSELSAAPFTTLSQAIGPDFDLGESDCNISLTNTLIAKFSPTGSDATFRIDQRYDFDNSATCQDALGKLQEKIFLGGTIPAFFFEWAYYQGLSLDQLDQLESMTFSYELQGTKTYEDTAGSAGASSDAATLKRSISDSQRILFGAPKSFRKAATLPIVNLYR